MNTHIENKNVGILFQMQKSEKLCELKINQVYKNNNTAS